MTQTRAKPASEVRVLLTILFVTLCGISTASILLFNSKTTYLSPMKGVHFWSLSSHDLNQQSRQDEERVDAYSVGPEELRLLKQVRNFHRYEVKHISSGETPPLIEQRQRLEEEIRRYVEKRGAENYVNLGLVVRDQVLEAITRLVNQAKADQLALPLWMRRHPRDQTITFVKAHSGPLLSWAIQAGLIGHQFINSEEHRFILATMYKMQWLRRAESISEFDHHVTELERIAILVFQVEFETDLSINERLHQLDQIEKIVPNYPSNIMRIVLHYRAGDLEQARELLADATKKTPKHPSIHKLRTLIGTQEEEH